MRLDNEARRKIVDLYKTGKYTRKRLSIMFAVHRNTINNILYGVEKPFKYDVMDRHPLSLDRLKERGHEPKNSTNGLLTERDEYRTMVKCPEPGCSYTTTAHRLLTHLIKIHHRYDLEYLLDDNL